MTDPSIASNFPDPTVEIDFIQKSIFRQSYYRNNRAFGQKNLRCFPNCLDEHVDRHFCGRPLLVTVTIVSHKSSVTIDDVILIGKFNLLPIQLEDESPECLEHLLNLQGKSDGGLPMYFPGKIIKTGMQTIIGDTVVSTCLAEFNADCRGYHYCWNGSRFRIGVTHVFTVNAYVPSKGREIFLSPSQRYIRVCSVNSPQFVIVSLRRRGTKLLFNSHEKVATNEELIKRFLSTNVCLGTFEEFTQLKKSSSSSANSVSNNEHDFDDLSDEDAKDSESAFIAAVQANLKRKTSDETVASEDSSSKMTSKQAHTLSPSSVHSDTSPSSFAAEHLPAVGETVSVRDRSLRAVVLAYTHSLDLIVEYVDSKVTDTLQLHEIELQHVSGESVANMDYL